MDFLNLFLVHSATYHWQPAKCACADKYPCPLARTIPPGNPSFPFLINALAVGVRAPFFRARENHASLKKWFAG
jgi:hypothetical protein